MNKLTVIIIACAIITGCTNFSSMQIDTFVVQYEPVGNSDNYNQLMIQKVVENILVESGYEVTSNEVLHTISTSPISLGTNRWRANNEKWKLQYQLGFQVISGGDGRLYWTLTTKIVGTRSGREPRSFATSDFEESSELLTTLKRKVMSEFNALV